ncbi:MAG: M48 family metallopeptidase [Burkholderiales bacterium]|nr:M48 family metallopeptidase [Burkholderiales bacterium]
MNAVDARYFDGRSSRAHAVRLSVDNGDLDIAGDDIARRAPVSEIRVSEPLAHAPRIVTFSDGAFCEVDDNAAFAQILAASGHSDSFVVAWQNQWRGAFVAVFALIAFLFIAYRWVLPVAAEYAAVRVPLAWEDRLGREATAFLEKRIFSTTQLSQEKRDALADRFDAIVPEDGRNYAIRFRASKIGPNALALPGGIIYVTDELVELAPDDDAVLGVLAHELGHIEQRHLMRRLFASAAVGAAVAVLFGDVSTVLAALPAILIDLDYSRAMEREADSYAVALLRAKGISTGSLATLFERMQKAHDKRGPKGDWPAYLSTHPPTPERVELFRKPAN